MIHVIVCVCAGTVAYMYMSRSVIMEYAIAVEFDSSFVNSFLDKSRCRLSTCKRSMCA